MRAHRYVTACAVGLLMALTPALAVAQDTPDPRRDPPASVAPEPSTAIPPAIDAEGKEIHPTPPRTGFSALVHTTVDDFVALPKRPSTWVILGIGGAVALAAHPGDENLNSHIVGSKAVGRLFAPGKFLGAAYTQVAVSVGLYGVGRYLLPSVEGEAQTNKVSHLGFDLLRAQILSQAMVQGMKFAIRRDRPTGECCSFPSGHAATAFAVASVLERHMGYRMSIPMLVGATYVGVSRLHDNRHFVSDVLFGAAIGTATGWTVVGRHGRSNYALTPTPVPGGFAMLLTRVGV